MKHHLIQWFEDTYQVPPSTLPDFRPGDTVVVHYKVEEASKGADGAKKYRIQAFEGIVLRRKRGITDPTFTIRKIGANGVGVERTFPLYSPLIDRVERRAIGRVRRARLYYLRNLAGKAARIRSRQIVEG